MSVKLLYNSDSSDSAPNEIDNLVGGESDVETNQDAADHETIRNEKSSLADVMSKILKKKLPNTKNVILSKVKTTKRRLDDKISDSDDSDSHIDFKQLEKKKEWHSMARKKPDPLEKDKERSLAKVATRGVVQLFNAVQKQQKTATDGLLDDTSETKKNNKGKTKGDFIDLLKNVKPKKDKNTHKWEALKDDFPMQSSTMKDWSDNEENLKDSDLSD